MQQDWPKEIWATQLAGLLTGKAMAAYTALCAVESEDYESMKKAVLHRYDVNEETHRLRFRQDRKRSEESFREWICRAADHFDCWVKDREIPLREMVIMEQVLLSVPEDLAVWLRERRPESLDELGKLADDYVLARTGESVRTQTKGPAVGLTTSSEKQGVNRRPIRRQEEYSTPAPEGGRARVNTHGDKQCFHCRQWGHLMYNCPNRKEWNVRGASKSALYGESCTEVAWDKRRAKYLQRGTLDGETVPMLVDTGCDLTLAHADYVDVSKVSGSETVPVRYVHGDTMEYPTAEVELCLERTMKTTKVAVAPTLPVPVPVLLGRDVWDMEKGFEGPKVGLLVETRAQKRLRERSEPTLPDQGQDKGGPDEDDTGGPGLGGGVEQSREEAQTTSAVEQGNLPVVTSLQATREEVKQWQERDPTLTKACGLAQQGKTEPTVGEGAHFYLQDGLLFRHWHPRGKQGSDVRACEQLVLPKECRSLVLRLAHDVPLAGHLGVAKTKGRVLQRYYWPGVFTDIAEYCRTCEVCQRSQTRKPARAPLVSMPLIHKPFQRIAMDLIGPLPKSKKGNRFILTICDYATRYPEAIPLPSTEAPRIVKELVLLFSRVGVPEEVLTDQGPNFMSALLSEVYRALQIRRIRTTPYHPQTDGLVERFNGTLKSMIKKFTSRNKRDWDEYLPYLLFAYREVPQESTGFSPFELLYGHRVRGPLDVIREGWTGERGGEMPVATHVVEMRDRLREMTDLVQVNVAKAQGRQRSHYDQGTTERAFSEGEQVRSCSQPRLTN